MKPFHQTVVVERPPCFERCCEVFGRAQVDRPGVIFSWGSRIYNPYNAPITRELAAHEAVHGMRQLSLETASIHDLNPYLSAATREFAPPLHYPHEVLWQWWERYLTDSLFRLDEELYAHHAEYKAGVKRHGHRPRDFNTIAERLASPLYGNLLTLDQAKHAILTGVVCRDPSKEEPRQRSAA